MSASSDPPFPAPPGMRWDASRRRFFRPDDSTARLPDAPSTSKRAAKGPFRWQCDGDDGGGRYEGKEEEKDKGEGSSRGFERAPNEQRQARMPLLARNSLSMAGIRQSGSSSLGTVMAQRRSNVSSFVQNLHQASYAFVSRQGLGKIRGIASDPDSPELLLVRFIDHIEGQLWTPDRVGRLKISDRVPIDQERKPKDELEYSEDDHICPRAARTSPVLDTQQTSCPDCLQCVDESGLGNGRLLVTRGLAVLALSSAVHLSFVDTPSMLRDPRDRMRLTGHFNYHPCLSAEEDPSRSSHYARATQSGITAVAANHQSGTDEDGRSWRSVIIAVAQGKYIQLAVVREEPDRSGLGICEHFRRHEVQDHPDEGLFDGGIIRLRSQCVALQISKDGRILYAGLRNGQLLLLPTDQMALLRRPTRVEHLPKSSMHRLMTEGDMCMTVLALVSEHELLVGWLDGTLRLVDAREPDRVIRRFVGHCAREKPNLPFAYDPKLRLFALVGEDLGIRIWSLDDSKPLLQPSSATARLGRPSTLLPGNSEDLEGFPGAGVPRSLGGRFGEMPVGLAFCAWAEAEGRDRSAHVEPLKVEQRPAPFMLAVACNSTPVVCWYH